MEDHRGNRDAAAAPPGTEGVIKFNIGLQRRTEALPEAEWVELEAWRSKLWWRGLVGYDEVLGLGFGNISVRRPSGGFVITGTQTGGLDRLDGRHYVSVDAWDFARNRVDCSGPMLPSSEAMSHAALYAANPAIGAVIHAHARSLWLRMLDARELSTPEDVPYGSVALYTRLMELASGREALPFLVAVAGHPDGVFAAGGDPAETCEALFARIEGENR